MSLRKSTLEIDVDGQRFTLKRPGRGGVARVSLRIAQRIGGDPQLYGLDGRGAKMEAVLHEYLTEGPADWRLKDAKGNPVLEAGKPVWTFEDADADLFGRVGEAAIEFHDSFRDIDSRFGVSGGIDV